MNDLEKLLYELETVENSNEQERIYPKPELKFLTQEQIDDIHQRGMLTPEEMLEEFKEMQYCPFTNGCSRCSEFENCNDCLIDYVNTQDEWMSFVSFAESLFKPVEKEDTPKMLIRE